MIDELHRVAAATPDAPAIVDTERRTLSYGALAATVNELATQLGALGIGPRATIGLAHPDGPEMITGFLGIARQCECAPLNPRFTRSEFEFEIDDLGLAAMVVGAGRHAIEPAVAAATAKGIPVLTLAARPDAPAGATSISGPALGDAVPIAAIDADRVGLVLHTSGTTARPKIVPLRHRNLAASAHAVAATLRLTPDDRGCVVMPLFHIHGLIAGVGASLVTGAGIISTPGFSAPDMPGWLRDLRATWYTAVPTMHQALLERVRRVPEVLDGVTLRFIRSSSSSLAPSVMHELESTFGAPVIESYGMTEAAHQMTSNDLPPGSRVAGSVGPPAGPAVAIMDDAGRLLPPGAVGEVVIQGPSVVDEYRDNPDATAAAFTNGWFRTGDQGRFDDGRLYLTGRLKEIINRGGENISPREIDEVLLEHPAVAQVVTFAVPDARLGEQVAAAYVPVAGETIDELALREFVALELNAAKVPRRILALDELPKGPSGKLQRVGLADRLGLSDLDADTTAVAAADREPAGPVESFLAEMWCEALGVDSVTVQRHFLDLGGDSLAAARLLARVRDEIDVELSMLSFFDAPTIEAQAELIEKLLLATDAL